MVSQTSPGDSGWTLIKFAAMAAFVEKDLRFSLKKKKKDSLDGEAGGKGW